MKRLISGLAAAIGALGVFLAAEREAHALGPIDLEAGLKVGAATKPDVGDNAPTPYGVGLGARGGVGIFNLYLGVSAIHYLGGSVDIPATPPGTTGGEAGLSSTLLGGEVGYTIGAIPLLQIRPQIGVGTAIFNASAEAGGISVDSSESHLYLEPGLTVLVPLGLLYVGADANALILPGVDQTTASGGSESETFVSLSLHGQLGIRL